MVHPSVIYKETPIASGYGESRYTMPKPCWAIVEFLIEPLPKGSGLIYESKVRTEKVKIKYQREIEDNLDKILSQGIYGWPVTDLKITFMTVKTMLCIHVQETLPLLLPWAS